MSTPIPFRELTWRWYSSLRDPTFAVVRSQESWDSLYPMDFLAPEKRRGPGVDWESEMVIAVMLGPRPRGGYLVHLDLSADLDGLHVAVREQPPSGPSSQAITYPALAVVTAARTDSVRFHVLPPPPAAQD